MRRLSPKILLIIAVILSIGTAGLVYSYLQANTQAKNNGDPVVVAVKDIPGRTVITADMVKVITLPPDLVQPGSAREVSKVIGVMTRVPIVTGDQVTEKRLAVEGKVSGFTGSIPHDKRAFTISATDVTGVAGFVKAGDYVDIVAAFDKSVAGENMSALLLQNILVLAANHNDDMDTSGKDKKSTEKMVSVTLAVSPDEAGQLALAEAKGKVHIALRPFQTSPGISAARIFTPQDLVGGYYHTQTPKSESIPVQAVVQVTPAPAPAPTPAPVPEGVRVIKGTKAETIFLN